MKKLTNLTGIIGAAALVASVVFKYFHLMGAPELLLLGTVGLGLFLLLFIVQKILRKAK